MFKKIIIGILVLSLISVLSGCGEKYEEVEHENSTYESSANNDPATLNPGTTDENDKPKEVESAPEPAPAAVPEQNVNIEWKTITETRKENGGYTFEITYKIGPWILLSDANNVVMEKAWKEIDGGKNTLPGFNEWGLKRNEVFGMNGYNRSEQNAGYFAIRPMTDMYYRMGSVQIKNITDGWSITENNPMSFNVWMNSGVKDVIGGSSASILRVFFSSGVREVNQLFTPQLKSDKWGPCSFIFMTGESFEPDNPDGRFFKNIQESVFKGKHGAIFGKDGVYTPALADAE